MNNISANNKRLARNTIALYFRMFLLMLINLYVSRVVLNTLGISDYGLYNVVGGVVAMFGFLNATLSTSTQRYLNIEIGKGDQNKLKIVFSTSLFLHVMLAIIIFFFAETIGTWFVTHKLNIPSGRENAALWVYQFSLIAVCVQVVQLPFMSTIIAHERMSVYAYVSILEALMKLAVVIILPIIAADKLILYGFLILVVHIVVAIIYNIYSRKTFCESRISIRYDKRLFSDMLGFSSWNVIGNLASVCNSQGLNIILNLFFGTVVNAARGVAFMVHSVVQQFVNNFQLAVKPQVIKYYASGQIEEMTKLVINAAKYSAFLMILINIPLIVEIKPLLRIWFGEYPDYAPIFITIILFRSIITSMTGNVVMVVHASGYLKKVGIYSGLTLMMVLPVSYLLLRIGCSPVVPFIVNVIAAFGEVFFELYWMNHYIQFPMWRFYRRTYLIVLPLAIVAYLSTYFIGRCVNGMLEDIFAIIAVCMISVAVNGSLMYFLGLDRATRLMVEKKFKSIVCK